jgi:hypothetical protein
VANVTDLRIDLAAEFKGAKAFKQAENSTFNLEKSIKNLGKTLGLTLGTAAVLRFGKESVKAYLEDEKAAAKLTNTVNNLGLSLSADSLNRYVERLSLATGVVDDQLRPALQSLLQVTGSATLSQNLLSQAVEISRGSQEDLLTVANDLSQAYVGNTRGLRKYNLGLTQAELKTASFEQIMKRFNKLFAGANAAYLQTYAGKMEILTTTAGEAKEVIGKGLVDGLVAISGEQAGVQGTANAMMDLAQAIADISLGFGTLIGKLNSTPIVGDLLKATNWVLKNTGVLGGLRYIGEQERLKKERAMMPSGTVGSGIAQGANMQSIKRETEAEKRAKALAKAQADNTKALKEQAKVKKLSAVFDLDQIQIVAALKGRISEEERTRLLLQSALLMGNADEARRLTIELSKTVGMSKDLSDFLRNLPDAKNPFELWQSYLDAIIGKIKTIQIPPAMSNLGQTGFADFGGAAFEKPTNPFGTGSYYGATGRDMPSNLNIVVTGGDAITQQLRFDLIGSSASGSASSLNRTTSSF